MDQLCYSWLPLLSEFPRLLRFLRISNMSVTVKATINVMANKEGMIAVAASDSAIAISGDPMINVIVSVYWIPV